MMSELKDLIVATTDLVKAATKHLGGTTTKTVEGGEQKPTRTRVKKEDVEDAAKGVSTVEKDAAPEMSQDESAKAVFDVAKAYIRGFNAQADGVAAVKKVLVEKFKVGKLADLVHDNRVELIAILKGGMTKTEATPALASGGIGI